MSSGSSSATLSDPALTAERVLGREAAIPEGTNPDNLNSIVSFATSNEKIAVAGHYCKELTGQRGATAF